MFSEKTLTTRHSLIYILGTLGLKILKVLDCSIHTILIELDN